MGKNSHLHIILETEFLESLKKQASERNISLSELCRQKLYDALQLDRIEFMIGKVLDEKGFGKREARGLIGEF